MAQHSVELMMPIPDQSHDAFITALVDRLSLESAVTLNPHCLSERTLYNLFDDIFARARPPRPSKEGTKKWLEEIGLLTPIPIEQYPEHGPTRRTRFYRLDVLRRGGSPPSPLDLLHAYDQDGVICYFTAIAFHTLSTQPPAHHHLAVPVENRGRAVATRPAKENGPAPTRKVDPLGTWQFTHKGIRYYKTSRDKRLFPGIQSRYTGPTSLIRITTLEQTLLDTLHRPLSCGGPAVVMEAWEQGLSRMNEEKLARNLREMNYLPTAQRLGYLLGNFGYKPGSELGKILQEYLARLNPNDPSFYQQLLPGLKYTHPKTPWLVYGPD